MKTEIAVKVNFTVKCELTEGELRALDGLVGYGFDEFVKCFYAHMGESYLKPYENDLKLLFKKIEELRPEIANIQEARKKLGLPYGLHHSL
jgi:ABC-type sugar transport system ATPase subunit